MAFYVFDLDGTLADCSHRGHHVRNGNRNWDQFFKECVSDKPIEHTIELLRELVWAGHQVEIWSGRSDVVRKETKDWLDRHVGILTDCYNTSLVYASTFLTRMRPAGDNIKDTELKKSWLLEYRLEDRPDIIFDDRKTVVDMWRSEGQTCFQVAPGDFDDIGEKLERIKPLDETKPMLYVMVGPSGAGKTKYAEKMVKDGNGLYRYVSSDLTRVALCGDFQDQSRNNDVFRACHQSTKALIESGIPVIFDATYLRNKDRKAVTELCPKEYKVQYVVVDRPLKDKIRDGGWRNDVIRPDGKTLIEYHDQIFKSNLKDILNGDGYENVEVLDARFYE